MGGAPTQMRFALNQFTTSDLPFDGFLALCRDLDILEVELAELKLAPDPGTARDQIKALTDAGIAVCGAVPRVHSLLPDTLNPQMTDLNERLRAFHASIDFFAAALPGINLPLVTITGAAPHANLREAYAHTLLAYGELSRHAADVGIRIAFEPLGPVLMNTDTFICSLYRAMELIERVDHPAFGLALDSWHVWDEPALAERIVTAGKRIFAVHVSDYPRNEPRGFGDRIIPGEGRADFPAFLGAVEAAGYRGPLSFEIFSDTAYPDSLWHADPRTVVKRGRAAMEDLWAARR